MITGSVVADYVLFYALAIGIAYGVAVVPLKLFIISRYQTHILRVLQILLIAYCLLIIIASYISYRNYSEFIDLSYYDSAIAQMAQFRVPQIWDMLVPVWSQHFSPILYLLVPLYWFGGGASGLVVAQAFLATLACVPLYLVVRTRSHSSLLAIAIAWSYILFGGLQSSIFYGFHEVTIFPFFFFWTVYFLESKKFVWFVLALILTLLVKEEIAFTVGFFGIYLVLHKQWKYGVTAIVAALVWYVVSFGVIARFHHGGYEYWAQFGGGSGGGVLGLVGYALTHPLPFIAQLFNDQRKVLMLIEVFGSFALLPFLYVPTLVMLIPSMMLKLLSTDIPMMNSFHYSAVISGLLPIAVLYAITAKQRFIPHGASWHRYGAVVILLVACVGSWMYGLYYYYGIYPKMTLRNIQLNTFVITAESTAIDDALAQIPGNATVNCQYQLCSHIVRPVGDKYPIPNKTFQFDYVVFDTKIPLVLTTANDFKAYYKDVVLPNYDLVYTKGSAYVFKKK